MNTNSNTYTVIYATVLVVFVAAVLAFVSTSLKDKQQRNVDLETKQSILISVNLASEADQVKDKASYIEKEYSKYITDSYIVDNNGDKIAGDAFKVNLKEQYDIMRLGGDVKKLQLPVFVCTTDEGKKVEVFPVYGAGLWGPIWGYVSIMDDYNTVYGAYFGHKSETPGLGAEIAAPFFRNQFKDKEIFENGKFRSVTIKKGGATPGSRYEVDAISGGTITSRALDKTIFSWLEFFMPYIQKQKAAAAVALEAPATAPATEEIINISEEGEVIL
jgi:Na+-transporting NADH:ubiquinone oxidoreductase subunit C